MFRPIYLNILNGVVYACMYLSMYVSMYVACTYVFFKLFCFIFQTV
jgi:hypothetical protein